MNWNATRREILKHAREAQQTAIQKLERPYLDTARARIGREPTCGTCPGPYACCRMLVVTSLLDGIPIAERVLASGDADLPRLLADQAAHQCEVSRSIAGGVFYDRQEVCNAWWARNEPCVFLRNDRCIVYDVRPMPCRLHMAFSEPRCCNGEDSEKLLTIAPNLGITIQHLFWARELEKALGLQRKEPIPYADVLPAIVCVAMDAIQSNTEHRFRRVLSEADAQLRTSGSSPTG